MDVNFEGVYNVVNCGLQKDMDSYGDGKTSTALLLFNETLNNSKCTM